jgi:hypothetical protein
MDLPPSYDEAISRDKKPSAPPSYDEEPDASIPDSLMYYTDVCGCRKIAFPLPNSVIRFDITCNHLTGPIPDLELKK